MPPPSRHYTDANEAANFPSTIHELLKILPKRETTLQIRMENSTASSQILASNNANRNNNNRNTNNHNNHRNNNSSSSAPNNNSSGPCYHTLRYDFKPASINSEEPAILELTQNDQVTIKAPNVGGSISNQTVFRGQRRPHVKECLLVIDNITGEMVLQKLTDNITVKATRSLGGGGGGAREGEGSRDGGERTLGGAVLGTGATPVLQIADRGNIGNNSGSINLSPPSNNNINNLSNNNHNHHLNTSTSNNLSITKNDGPQLSEDSSSSDESSSDSSSSSSSSSSSNSGNSSPNNEGFTF